VPCDPPSVFTAFSEPHSRAETIHLLFLVLVVSGDWPTSSLSGDPNAPKFVIMGRSGTPMFSCYRGARHAKTPKNCRGLRDSFHGYVRDPSVPTRLSVLKAYAFPWERDPHALRAPAVIPGPTVADDSSTTANDGVSGVWNGLAARRVRIEPGMKRDPLVRLVRASVAHRTSRGASRCSPDHRVLKLDRGGTLVGHRKGNSEPFPDGLESAYWMALGSTDYST